MGQPANDNPVIPPTREPGTIMSPSEVNFRALTSAFSWCVLADEDEDGNRGLFERCALKMLRQAVGLSRDA